MFFMLNSLHAGSFFMLLLSSADFFFKINFKKSFRNTIRVSNGPDLDPKGPDLGPNDPDLGPNGSMIWV